MSKNNKKYPIPVGTEFTYRNQKYVIARDKNIFPCITCEEVNSRYIENDLYKCVALTKTGANKFCCTHRCGPYCYPKRVK